MRAPKCDIEVELTVAPVDGTDTMERKGKLMATGTDPEPYVIFGETGNFILAQGTIGSDLKNITIDLRY